MSREVLRRLHKFKILIFYSTSAQLVFILYRVHENLRRDLNCNFSSKFWLHWTSFLFSSSCPHLLMRWKMLSSLLLFTSWLPAGTQRAGAAKVTVHELNQFRSFLADELFHAISTGWMWEIFKCRMQRAFVMRFARNFPFAAECFSRIWWVN